MLGSVSFRKAHVPEGTSSEKTGSPAPPAEVTTPEEVEGNAGKLKDV